MRKAFLPCMNLPGASSPDYLFKKRGGEKNGLIAAKERQAETAEGRRAL